MAIMQHVNVFKHPVFFLIPVALCASIYMFSKSSLATGDLFGTDKVTASFEANRKDNKASKPAQQLTTGPIVPIERNGQLVFTNRKEPKQ